MTAELETFQPTLDNVVELITPIDLVFESSPPKSSQRVAYFDGAPYHRGLVTLRDSSGIGYDFEGSIELPARAGSKILYLVRDDIGLSPASDLFTVGKYEQIVGSRLVIDHSDPLKANWTWNHLAEYHFDQDSTVRTPVGLIATGSFNYDQKNFMDSLPSVLSKLLISYREFKSDQNT